MVAEQITNKEIRRIFDRYIVGQKDKNFFLISTGSFSAQKLDPIHEKSIDFTGEDIFLELLDEAFEHDSFYIGIGIYHKAVSKLKEKPFFYKQIALKKPPANQNESFGGLGDMFGGLEGVMQSKIDQRLLSTRNDDLSKQVEKLEKTNTDLIHEKKNLLGKIDDLKEQIRNKEWDLKNIQHDHKNELQSIDQKNDRFERFVTLGGLVLAKASGLSESDLRGILGFDDQEQKSIEDTAKSNKNIESDVDFEETIIFEGKKKDAKLISDEIYKFLISLIEKNTEEDAFRLINSINYIINFIKLDVKNLQSLIGFVSENSKNKETAADKVMTDIDNYHQNQG